MERRAFLRVMGGGVVVAATGGSALLAGCSKAVPPEVLQAWGGADPALAQSDPRRWVLSHALLAPNAHNLQSWKVDLREPEHISLYCDLERLLPQTDPFSRQIMLSQGTFLELLDLAARAQGLRADITLFPDGAPGPEQPDARPVARVRLQREAGVPPDPLFAQVLRRRTHRGLYDPARPVTDAAWATLRQAVAGVPSMAVGHAGVQDAATMEQLRRIAQRAWDIEMTTPPTVLESYQVLRIGAEEVRQHRDGITLMEPLPVLLARTGLLDRSKAPAVDDYATTSQIQAFAERLQSTPGYLWISSADNARATQVQSGRAYARVQLAATALGLSMQPLSQALQEYPEQAQPYADIHRLTGAAAQGRTLQMWVRVGYAAAIEPAPRRRLSDLERA